MRNSLPKRCNKYECGIINLQSEEEPGSHWVGYYVNKKDKICYYYDSFGDLQPFKEFIKYIGNSCIIHYNYAREQNFDSFVCGHLCLKFLFNLLCK